MKLDEFAFVNQQLASMLKDGIPLEGALRQLCATMQRGGLRAELQALEADLGRGVPLKDALVARKLPDFYKHMLQVGVQSNDLPALLVLLADYYQRMNSVWTRLKGLLVYPIIVLVACLALSVALTWALRGPFQDFARDLTDKPLFVTTTPAVWLPPICMAVLVAGLVTISANAKLRGWMRWNFPAFKEASLSQLASAMALMLEGGCRLDEVFALMRHLEEGTPAGTELAHWQDRLASGQGRFVDIADESIVFPSLFIWLVAGAGEDVASGFRRAAQLYYDRSVRRIETLLYAVLPVSMIVLGLVILGQFVSLFRGLILVEMSAMGGN